jgi:SAM-dependent methyltransferase
MYTESAEFYDVIYSNLKDYQEETRQVAELLRRIQPSCRTILDVACGTGEHASLLASQYGFEVDGLDLDPSFVAIARAKHPKGRFYQADMTKFELGRSYDAIVCLFSSIGYVGTVPRLRQTLQGFRNHIVNTGAIIVEPFFKPEDVRPGYTNAPIVVQSAERRITRSSHSEVEGRVFRLYFDYQIEGLDGTRHVRELHELGLFTVEEMLDSFETVGLRANYHLEGPSGRGLYIATVV